MTTVALQTQPQLHDYMITLISREQVEQDGYPVPADTQILQIPYFQPSLTREFLEQKLADWLDDYFLAGWRKIDNTIVDEF